MYVLGAIIITAIICNCIIEISKTKKREDKET